MWGRVTGRGEYGLQDTVSVWAALLTWVELHCCELVAFEQCRQPYVPNDKRGRREEEG